jgi:glycogen synthase
MSRRILMTTDVVGGVWDFCLVLAAEVRASALASVTLLALGEPSAAQRRAARAAGADLLSAPLKLEWMQDAATDVAATRGVVADIARRVRADVVHANQFAAACADTDVPVVLTVHSDVLSWRRWSVPRSAVRVPRDQTDAGAALRPPRAEPVPEEWRPYAVLVREALTRADAVVAVSDFLAREVRSLYGVDRRIEVIHDGWPAPPEPGPPNAERGTVTLVAGRVWDAAKNIALAAEAAAGWEPGQVLLAGEQLHPDTAGRAEVRAPMEPLGFVPRSDLDAYLRRSAIYLSPARYDPFGLLPLQAALNGCALLLSDIPSYRELWDGAACFFRSDDAADLRAKWHALLQDCALRSHLQWLALERTRERFTPERMVGAYRQLYAQRQRVAA